MPNLRGKTWTTTTPANVEDAQYWEDHLISDTAAAKAASSVQSVNSITPDQYGNVEIGNAGHTIQDDDGNDMPKQDVLQFVNADVTNDTVNEKTVVDCKGAKGDAATITVGTVTTLPAGSDATVTNSGTSHAAVFNFGIPKGADGTGSVDSVNGYTGTVVLDASDVGALPDSTTIPTKTSELDNDSGFVTSSAIPTSLSELSDDSTHRLVTDAEKTAWDAKVSESLLKDTVGWVGKNDLPCLIADIKSINTSGTWSGNSYTINGITIAFSVNSDGAVTGAEISGTASANADIALTDFFAPSAKTYTFSKGASTPAGCMLNIAKFNNTSYVNNLVSLNGATTKADVSVDYDGYNRLKANIFVTSGTQISTAVTVYPMLRDASITDSTFEPYHKSVEDWYWENNAETGVHNYLPYPYTDKGNKTSNDITFIDKGKGVITVKAGTASASGDASYYLWGNPNTNDYKDVNYLAGKKIAKFTSDAKIIVRIWFYASDKSYITGLDAWEKGCEVSIPSNAVYAAIVLRVNRGTTISSDTDVSPSLMLVEDTYEDFSDYAMTNRELTEMVKRTKLFGTDDLDTVFGYGDYYWENAYPVHTPENQAFGSMRVYPCGEVIHQEIIRASGGGALIYMRRYQNSWSSWYKFSGTVVS